MMDRVAPALSRGLLIVGGLLILAGLGWGLWGRVNAPPPPTIGAEGAVVLAVTAPSLSTGVTAEPSLPPPTATPAATLSSTPEPLEPPAGEEPTPELLPDWTVTPAELDPTSAPIPTSSTPQLPTATLGPTATPRPPAEKPPTRIVAPAIDLDADVVSMGWEMVDREGRMVSQWVVPPRAAGWHMNSALPGHGENVVLSGHHNIGGKVFRYVVDLEPGDAITLHAEGRPYEYVVTEKYILKEAGMPLKVRRANAQWIMPTGDERLTLVTCWPYEWPGNSHRVIVVARPSEYFQQSVEDSE